MLCATFSLGRGGRETIGHDLVALERVQHTTSAPDESEDDAAPLEAYSAYKTGHVDATDRDGAVTELGGGYAKAERRNPGLPPLTPGRALLRRLDGRTLG